MKARVPSRYEKELRKEADKVLTEMAKQTKAALAAEVETELKARVEAANKAYELELDALVLWTLHARFGFGYKRLSAFYEALFQERQELHNRYLPAAPDYSDNGVESGVAYHRLRDFGYDVKTHFAELNAKYPIQTFPENEKTEG
ncbi:MAG: hypothetical protein E7576_08090 [Ruminococcaceae bacterium]|nr:hypothetical protein [Oscillospiraceae bacterium]